MAQPRLRHSEKFRTYQRQAIEMVRRYRNNYSDLPNVEHPTSGAALVCHPTGTGKTVVIAGLAHAAPEIGSVLVLTTREAVRDQLSRELAGDLFIDASKFGLGINIRLAKVVYVVEEGRALLGEVGDLHGSSCKPYGADLRAFSKRQFDRLVDKPKQRFLDELATGRSIVLMTVQMLVSLERETHAAFAAFANISTSCCSTRDTTNQQ
jgi:Type III restriction enzyme, res subunit